MCRAGACDQARGIEPRPAAGLEPGWGVRKVQLHVPYAVFELAYFGGMLSCKCKKVK